MLKTHTAASKDRDSPRVSTMTKHEVRRLYWFALIMYCNVYYNSPVYIANLMLLRDTALHSRHL